MGDNQQMVVYDNGFNQRPVGALVKLGVVGVGLGLIALWAGKKILEEPPKQQGGLLPYPPYRQL